MQGLGCRGWGSRFEGWGLSVGSARVIQGVGSTRVVFLQRRGVHVLQIPHLKRASRIGEYRARFYMKWELNQNLSGDEIYGTNY